MSVFVVIPGDRNAGGGRPGIRTRHDKNRIPDSPRFKSGAKGSLAAS